MSLYDRAQKDNARILAGASGFTVAVVFVSPSGRQYATRGFYTDTNLGMDMATGLPKVEHKLGLTVSMYDASGALVFTTEDPATTPGDWRFTITNSIGEERTYTVEQPMADKTMGYITMTGKAVRRVDAEDYA